jgi:hypothetical protein
MSEQAQPTGLSDASLTELRRSVAGAVVAPTDAV